MKHFRKLLVIRVLKHGHHSRCYVHVPKSVDSYVCLVGVRVPTSKQLDCGVAATTEEHLSGTTASQ